MKAIVRRIGGLGVAGKADSNHWVPMDAAQDVGGSNAASRPLELVLIGLGGCTGMDVLSILAKKHVKLDDFQIELEADRAPEHPRVFTAIRMTFHFFGEDLNLDDLQSAVRLSEETYCSVSAMLRRAVPITAKIEAHPPRPAR